MCKGEIKLEDNDKAMLFNIISDILGRGNDAEIKQSKDGIKILEISKKVRIEIKTK